MLRFFQIHFRGDSDTLHFRGDSDILHFWGDSDILHFRGDSDILHFWGDSDILHFWGDSRYFNFWGDSDILHFWGDSDILHFWWVEIDATVSYAMTNLVTALIRTLNMVLLRDTRLIYKFNNAIKLKHQYKWKSLFNTSWIPFTALRL